MANAYLNERCLGRVMAGHPWIYSGDIRNIEQEPEAGKEIMVGPPRGGFIGTGFFNPKSKIPIRILSRERGEKLDEAFFKKRIQAAWDLRTKASGFDQTRSVFRVVWSEADFLPGLIVDRYDKTWVIQTLTLAMDQRKEMIAKILKESFGAEAILERNDVSSRGFEGLEQKKGWLYGEGQVKPIVTIGRAKFEVDLLEGQKTGEYLDQVQSQMAVGDLCHGKKVLDCFAYHGGFAIHAALGGAAAVEAVDISADAVAVGSRNAELNKVQITWKEANVFDDLNDRVKAGEQHDVVILDPPSFTKSRAKVDDALRGYKEINLRAFKLLSSGGLLASFCCSHHVDATTFRDVMLDAAFDARKILRLRAAYAQPPDHPVIPAVPETEYLKGFLFEVV